MSNLGSLKYLWDPASMDELLNELSQVAFEEEGFDPAIVDEMMAKFEEEAEASWAAMDAAEEEQLCAAEAELNHVMDTCMAELDTLTRHAIKEFEKLSHVEKAAWEEADRMSASASKAAKKEIKNPEFDRNDSHAVIREAMKLGLQIIKNAELKERRELSSGAFGTVYYGKWGDVGDVAIKRIKNSCFVGKPSEQERLRSDFWREAGILAQSRHPNIVYFYGVVPDGPGGTLAIVTEYMVNGSLKQVLQEKEKYGGIDKRKLLKILMDAASGMEYLHGKNIVHFDLKCENLFVDMRDPRRPICKVGDLGLSKIRHQTLVSGGLRGTLRWMAPELFNGSSNMVSEKVDVFSFGIVMWELLTGEEPYADMHDGAIMGGIVNNTLRPPITDDCDPSWRLLMERCWSEDPSARPNFTEIKNEIMKLLRSLPPKRQGHP